MARRTALVPVLGLLAALLATRGAPWAAAAGGPPKIRSVAPVGGARGATVDVVIEGTSLFPLEEVTTSSNDVGAVVQPSSNEHHLIVRLTIPETAAAGTLTIKIRTKDGTATTDRFQVRMRLPAISRVVPDSVRRGGTYDLVLSGTNLSFAGAETVVTTDAPMTATRQPKSTDKVLQVKLVVPPETPPGSHPLTVETSDGKFTASFVVLLSPPSVTGIDPAAVVRGGEAVLTLKGQNLSGASVVLAGPDENLTLTPGGEITATTVPLRVTARPGAAPGPRLLVLQTADGLSTASFEVSTSPPKSLVVQPPGAVRGVPVDLVAKGDGLPADAELRFVPQDPAVRLEKAPSGGLRVVVAPDARPGPRTLVAVAKDGVVTTTFNVGLRAPSVSGVVPAEVAPGSEADLAFEGQHLEGVEYALAGAPAGVEGGPSQKSPAMFHVKVAADARPGPRLVVLRTREGTAVMRFTVTGPAAGAPSATGVVPGRVLRGRASAVVVSGLNLRAAGDKPPDVAATAAGGGAIPAKVLSSTPSSLTLEVSPAADAALGGGVVVLATPDGTAAVALQVDPALPSLTSASPARVSRPATAEVVLSGVNLMAPGGAPPKVSLVPARSGATGLVLSVLSASPEQATARVALDASAVPGSYLLVLESPEGGAAIPFEVEPAPPAVQSVVPASVGTPAVADLVVTGKSLLEPDGKPPKVQVTRLGASASAQGTVVQATADSVTVRVTTLSGGIPGPHLLLLRTADGVAAGVFQVVASPPPQVSALDQGEGVRMSNVLTSIRGTNLKGATEVAFDGKGVSAVILAGGNDQELHVRIVIAADAEPGLHGLTVTAPGGVATNEKVVFRVR